MEKYLIKLTKENDGVGIEFCLKMVLIIVNKFICFMGIEN